MAIFKSLKIIHHKDRLDPYIYSYPAKHDTVPILFELDITNACTHLCPRCCGMRSSGSSVEGSYSTAGDGNRIPTDRASDYIQQMGSCGVRSVLFTGGGEPSAHRDLVPLITMALDLGMDVGLITHGGLLHHHNMSSVVPRCTWIRFSLDAGSPTGYRRTHGKDETEWNTVWKNIQMTVGHKGSSRVTIGVAFLTDERNIDELPLLAKLCVDTGVSYLQVRPFHSGLNFDPRQAIADAQSTFDNPSFRIVSSAQKYDLIKSPDRTYGTCHIAQFAGVICADERVYMCCHTRGLPDFCIGDLRTQTLREILSSCRRPEVTSATDVNQCPLLCRGDQVNRQVEQILSGEELVSTEPTEHVNLL